MQLIMTLGKASLYRKETYCGRSTPIIRWVVQFVRPDGNIRDVADCSTRKDAMHWLDLYSKD